MPFDFDTYQSKCENLTPEQLHREWENYTRQISGGATSTATAVLFSPLTAGISLVGLGLSAPRIHNARKKRAIIEAKLQAHGQTHNTRKRDVIAPMAISGTIGGLTLGLAGPGADLIAGEAVGKGAEYAAAQIYGPILKRFLSVALDATGAVIEHTHDEHSKHKADQRMNVQYQNFQKQFIQEQAAQADPWLQHPVSPIMERRPATLQSSISSANFDCKSSITDFPMDVFELPAELVNAAVPDDDAVPATPSMEDEILILKARILQMEIEKRGGVIDIAPAHKSQPEDQVESQSFLQDTRSSRSASVALEGSAEHKVARDDTDAVIDSSNVQEQNSRSSPVASIVVEEPTEYQTAQIEIEVATETVYDFEPLSFYPPPPASPAPPPSSLPQVPPLQTTVQEITTLSAQLSLETTPTSQGRNTMPSNVTISAPSTNHNDSNPAPVNVMPIRQQSTPLPSQAEPQQSAPRHASLTPNYQTQYSTPEQHQPPLPSRPQSQIFQNTSGTQQGYPAPPPSHVQEHPPQPLESCQTQYTPQGHGASTSYNPQTYALQSSSLPEQQTQVPQSRPQSVYQPLSFQSSHNTAPFQQQQQQQQQNYPPPPPSPNPQTQRPAPPPRPQSVYQPQYAPHSQNTAAISYPQQPAPPRPQSVYQPQYAPPAQSAAPPMQQQQQAPSLRPQSVYQPLQFTPAQAPQAQPQQNYQNYAQPQPTKPTSSIQRQDSGYYSIPPSRHSSSFSTTSFTPSNYASSPQILSPQPTGMLSPQVTGSVYHGRSASVSTMGSPMTPQSIQQQQPYFPPPPGTPAPPMQNDYFGSKVAGYNPAANQQSQNTTQHQGQGYGTQGPSQGWQWGMPPPQPNYGAPPPIPQPWK
ncbi:hypothetical protein IFR04_005440 [Cadophora malorum]|uniref:Uncharacterized protein n=1 Tax=Cadophora malorum TaxID=108018 RepID=A0A8H7TL26_9HELO|nr:hypothetical protein IFR04_005440 [Cadophora malorum]